MPFFLMGRSGHHACIHISSLICAQQTLAFVSPKGKTQKQAHFTSMHSSSSWKIVARPNLTLRENVSSFSSSDSGHEFPSSFLSWEEKKTVAQLMYTEGRRRMKGTPDFSTREKLILSPEQNFNRLLFLGRVKSLFSYTIFFFLFCTNFAVFRCLFNEPFMKNFFSSHIAGERFLQKHSLFPGKKVF